MVVQRKKMEAPRRFEIRETLIKSQSRISYGFLYIASSSSSLNSVAPRRRFPAIAYVILTVVQERSLGCARDDDMGKGYHHKFESKDAWPRMISNW